MLALLTSSNRPDLLEKTLSSLFEKQYSNDLKVIIHEDAIPRVNFPGSEIEKVCDRFHENISLVSLTNKLGQHKSIEKFLDVVGEESKYYLHLEDDWQFENTYNWIYESLKIMERDDSVIKVLCRKESPHPCEHDRFLTNGPVRISNLFGYLKPWTGPDEITWHGFSWNPGVTRISALKKFLPFPAWEQDLAKNIYDAGYKTVELSISVYTHIGDGRSTHN